jgi:hypothetical protein
MSGDTIMRPDAGRQQNARIARLLYYMNFHLGVISEKRDFFVNHDVASGDSE